MSQDQDFPAAWKSVLDRFQDGQTFDVYDAISGGEHDVTPSVLVAMVDAKLLKVKLGPIGRRDPRVMRKMWALIDQLRFSVIHTHSQPDSAQAFTIP